MDGSSSPDSTPTPPEMHPPVPLSDFVFTFDPALSSIFPPPPPLPPSADLFTPSETTDFLGFLDNFNWEFDAITEVPRDESQEQSKGLAPYHRAAPANAPPSSRLRIITGPSSLRQAAMNESPISYLDAARDATTSYTDSPMTSMNGTNNHMDSRPPTRIQPSSAAPPSNHPLERRSSQDISPRAKPLLSTPQKRLNHIMSEQKRRNAIRDGYAQLIDLLAPAGSPPGLGMPTRGRPKGSGSRGKGRSKGKSGVLFRAVEYIRWLEESRDALRAEVLRVEGAAGISAS